MKKSTVLFILAGVFFISSFSAFDEGISYMFFGLLISAGLGLWGYKSLQKYKSEPNDTNENIISKVSYSKKNITDGYIGYFNLSNWWENTFTSNERKYIAQKYGTTDDGTSSLIKGKVYFNGTVSEFLTSLSGWFLVKNDLHIALKIVKKAEELYDDNLDVNSKHFYFLHLIKVYYKDRENEDSLNKAICYCNKQIMISAAAKKSFIRQFPNSNLPSHTGYEQLSIIEEKNKNYEKALAISQNAKNEGWTNDWDKRIERLSKKM